MSTITDNKLNEFLLISLKEIIFFILINSFCLSSCPWHLNFGMIWNNMSVKQLLPISNTSAVHRFLCFLNVAPNYLYQHLQISCLALQFCLNGDLGSLSLLFQWSTLYSALILLLLLHYTLRESLRAFIHAYTLVSPF